jgi:hypothetical protein
VLKGTIAGKQQFGSVQTPPICSMKLPRWRDSASLRPLVSASLRLRLARPQVAGQLISCSVRRPKVDEWHTQSTYLLVGPPSSRESP